MKYKSIIKPVVFLIVLFLILSVFSKLFTPKGEPVDSSEKKLNGILNEPQNSIDYLAIGDSECDSSISPLQIWGKYGYTGYNCGVPNQRLQDTYYLLQTALHNQSPKVVLLETNAFFRSASLYSEVQDISEGIVKHVFPIYKYHDRWKTFDLSTLKCFGSKTSYPYSDPFKGFNYNTNIASYTKGNYVKKTDKEVNIKQLQTIYLNKIVDLCREKNILLILYSVPSPVCWSYQKHNAVKAFAAKNKLKFIDLNINNLSIGIDWHRDTRDKGDHLNFYGAEKVTDYIGLQLSSTVKLIDHRKDEHYAEWNDDYSNFMKQIQKKKNHPLSTGDFFELS